MRLALTSLALLAVATPASAANIPGTAIILRTLDKVTATTQDYTVPVGETLQYGALQIDAVHCEKRPPEEMPETFAFLKIQESKLDGEGAQAEPETVFSGWMFASRPAVHALDHGVYDVWVIGCKTPPVELPEFTE
jgi:hypothetical protein